jgi:hypothetical protein
MKEIEHEVENGKCHVYRGETEPNYSHEDIIEALEDENWDRSNGSALEADHQFVWSFDEDLQGVVKVQIYEGNNSGGGARYRIEDYSRHSENPRNVENRGLSPEKQRELKHAVVGESESKVWRLFHDEHNMPKFDIRGEIIHDPNAD